MPAGLEVGETTEQRFTIGLTVVNWLKAPFTIGIKNYF